ncbi:MAG TPA: response regulator [Melioribacteraceae bacterium]|nr:response regulator [Melioribacteraceae bacterium]
MKVLVIEDDFDIRSNIETLLIEEGYIVETASNGFTGVEKAISFLPDIIICDIMMKGKTGYEVLDELLDNRLTKAIPFIFLTAKVDIADIRKGMDLGADDYLTKPFKNQDLLKTIEIRLNKRRIFRGEDITLIENKSANKKLTMDESVYIRSKEEIVFFKVSDINYISAANQYTKVILDNYTEFVFHKPLRKWEETLPEEYFLRIHNKTIIKLENIRKIERHVGNSFLIYLKNVEIPFEASRRKISNLNLFL